MPSATVPAAVLAVADTIWSYETWGDRVKNVTLPWDEGASTSRTNLETDELEAVRALAHRVHSKTTFRDRVNVFDGENDNDKLGKLAWKKWFRKVHPGWNMRKDIEKVLDAYDRHPRLLMGAGGNVSGSERRRRSRV